MPVQSKAITERKNTFGGILRQLMPIFLLVICFAVFGGINPQFLSIDNMLNILWQNSYLVVATLGMVFLLISGGVDLAMGFEVSFGTVIAAACMMWWHLPIWVAVIAGILVCVILSTINGLIVIKFKINALMVTLGTMTIYQGISYIFTESKAISNLPVDFKFIGQGSIFGVIPLPALIMVVLVGVASFILNSTYFGRYVYAVGGNMEAARLAGIKVQRTRFLIFMLAGFFFGVAAILLVSRTGNATSSLASGSEFTCLTAAVLGGIAIQGGEGKLWSVIIAVFILGILANGMQLIGLNIYYQYIAKGVILIGAMAFDIYQKTRKVKTLKAA